MSPWIRADGDNKSGWNCWLIYWLISEPCPNRRAKCHRDKSHAFLFPLFIFVVAYYFTLSARLILSSVLIFLADCIFTVSPSFVICISFLSQGSTAMLESLFGSTELRTASVVICLHFDIWKVKISRINSLKNHASCISILIHPIFVTIPQSEPKWWINQQI